MVNAALSVSALISSDAFDISKTYFLITGIAGVNPRKATIGSVALPKFAIQVDTQMEFDAREIPTDWSTGYVPLGAGSVDSYPKFITGSEIYELSDALRKQAMSVAKTVKLQDSPRAKEYRARFAESPRDIYHAATLEPEVLERDLLSSNTFWRGRLLGDAMGHVAKLYTTGKAVCVMTAQEDTGILAALLRAAIQGRVDFSRILITRAGSDFDCQPEDAITRLPFDMDRSGGLQHALRNLYLTGVSIVEAFLSGWNDQFEKGLKHENYVKGFFHVAWWCAGLSALSLHIYPRPRPIQVSLKKVKFFFLGSDCS